MKIRLNHCDSSICIQSYTVVHKAMQPAPRQIFRQAPASARHEGRTQSPSAAATARDRRAPKPCERQGGARSPYLRCERHRQATAPQSTAPATAFSTVVVATMLNTKDLTVFSTLKTGLTADFTPCFCDRKNIPHQSKRKTGRTFQRLLQNPSGHFARAESRIQESDCDEFRAVSFFAV